MPNKGMTLWDLHDRAASLMARDGTDSHEQAWLNDFETSLWAVEAGVALIRHGDVPRDLTRRPVPWLVNLLTHLGPRRRTPPSALRTR